MTEAEQPKEIEQPTSVGKLQQHVETTIASLDRVSGRLSSNYKNVTDEHLDEIAGVRHHVQQAQSSLAKGRQTGLGRRAATDTSIGHLSDAHESTQKAYNLLVNSSAYKTHGHHILKTPGLLVSQDHMDEQETRHSSIDRVQSKPTEKLQIGEHTFVRHPERPDTYVLPGSRRSIGPHNIDKLTKELGTSHPAIIKYNTSVRGTEKEQQVDPDAKPGTSPIIGKNQGFATEKDKEDTKVGQNSAGVVREGGDPRKKASRTKRQAYYAGASSELGKQNPADQKGIENIKAPSQSDKNRVKAFEVTRNDPFMKNPKTQQAVKRGIKRSRVKNMMLGQNQQLESVRSNLDLQSARNAVNKRRGQG